MSLLFSCLRTGSRLSEAAIIWGLTVLFASIVPAAEPVRLTLDQAILGAQQANPELRSAEAAIASARGAAVTAGTWANPELQFAYGIDMHIGVEQTFEWPGKRSLRRAIAEKNVAAAEAALAGLREAIAAEVRKTFAELLAAQESLQARQQAVTLAEQFAVTATRRVIQGYAPSFEQTKAELEVVRARMDFRQATVELDTARSALAIITGRPSSTLLAAEGVLCVKPPMLKLDTVIAAVLERHPDLRSQESLIAAREAAVPAARAAARPDVRVAPFYEESTFSNEKRVGVGLAVPLPLWNRNTGEIRQAEAESAKARAELDVTRRKIGKEVSAAFIIYQAARDRLSLWRPELVEQLHTAFAKVDEQYRAGQIGVAVRLDLQRSYFDAVRDGIEVQLAVARAAAALERAAVLPLEQMEKP